MVEERCALVTGCAGFIGFHVAKRFLAEGYSVVGVDNVNDYYDVTLKRDRLKKLGGNADFIFHEGELANVETINELIRVLKWHSILPDVVVHLAAQAGVGYCNVNPWAYLQSNLTAFWNVMLLANTVQCQEFLYASSSSVYGDSRLPFKEDNSRIKPTNLYGVTKLSNEYMAHAFYAGSEARCIGMRFFNVYGPWGRPDGAMWKFAANCIEGEESEIRGTVYPSFIPARRDFTYVDDIVESIFRLQSMPRPVAPLVVNIGGSQSHDILSVARRIGEELGYKSITYHEAPLQHGELTMTQADTSLLEKLTGYTPKWSIEAGITAFARWFKEYYTSDREPNLILAK